MLALAVPRTNQLVFQTWSQRALKIQARIVKTSVVPALKDD
jgi:hypothetical protein